MPRVGGAVALHKRQVKSLIDQSEHRMTILLPTERLSSNQNPLFGDLGREAAITSGTEIGPIACLWLDALSVGTGGTFGIETVVTRMAGHYTEATIFAEVWLDDILVDVDVPDGDTWLDQAKMIKKGNYYFQLLGYVRVGLPTVSPYIAVIAMKGGSGYGAGQ
jgi:hypothetical protein